MRVGIIGQGAIGRYVRQGLSQRGHAVRVVLLPPGRPGEGTKDSEGAIRISSAEDIPADIDHMIECAGHSGLASHGPAILRRGVNMTTVSIGALAEPALYSELKSAAESGGARLHLASGAIGALDCLAAARAGDLRSVTYTGRKPPSGWIGSPAETRLDLNDMSSGAAVHFEGTAREAAIAYPKNANVTAAVALAGLGFDATAVRLAADPDISENIHEIEATGDFGSMFFQVKGQALRDNPRSSALAAMSVIAKLEQQRQIIVL